MKRNSSFYIAGAALLIVFIILSLITFRQCNNWIENSYLSLEGTSAQNFAVLTAANIKLSDTDVAELKAMPYQDLLNSKQNNDLKTMMSDRGLVNKVDYAYIMVHLNENEVKYKVTEENKDKFEAPVGTPLEIMWLLDVNVNDDAYAMSDVGELQRYSTYIEDDARILGASPFYIFNRSVWGDHICGYAPLYSTEGTYIGAVGVELRTGDYDHYRKTAMIVLGVLLGVSISLLTVVFLFLYIKNHRMQLNMVYTDALTQMGNRSYYNDHFIKKMNSRRSAGKTFALIIGDIDWFKRVNDTFGHNTGDEVLVELAQIFISNFTKEHVFRFGGEEFVAGIWVNDVSALRAQLDKLMADIAGRTFTKRELNISMSTGVSYCRPDSLNGWLVSGMLRAADCKLYESKENGRCQYRMAEYDPKGDYPVGERDIKKKKKQ